MKTFALIFCILGLSASLVLGVGDFENLKAEAISQFVNQANSADSGIAKIIKAYNQETVDGRNQNGGITVFRFGAGVGWIFSRQPNDQKAATSRARLP